MKKYFKDQGSVFPLKKQPLVHCITNTVTVETMANALLYVDAKPIMTDDTREFSTLFQQTDSLLLNLGSLSKTKEQSLLAAAKLAEDNKAFVLDIVGAASAPTALALAHRLSEAKPAVLRGNISEMRAFCGLSRTAKGVDGSSLDQTPDGIKELIFCLKQLAQSTVYLATGKKDIIVAGRKAWLMANGVDELDRFTGSGDILGALIAALLGADHSPISAVMIALGYLNICGQKAKSKATTIGLADFRHETLNQLSLLANSDPNWFRQIKGEQQ
ncbi:MAG TPA: hydroxyethylthiazole kinase [Tetragenococcus sp.]|nr:hydroxyethylthiazole kinase [Tetragenococcus sp.]